MNVNTPLKTNMDPKNDGLEEEIHSTIRGVLVSILVFGVYVFLCVKGEKTNYITFLVGGFNPLEKY